MIYHTDTLESIRPLTPDERRALWAARYFALGAQRYVDPPEPEPIHQETHQ